MRAIDATLKARIELAQQTLYNNANPQMDVTVTRPRTPITRAGFWQESIVTAGATAVCTSVCVRRQVKHPTRAYVAYVTEGGTLVVKYADLTGVAFDKLTWITVETISGCTACAIEFDGSFVPAARGRVEYLTDELPWLFYATSAGALMAGPLGSTYEILAAANVTALDAVRGVASLYKDEDQGLILFYILSGSVYYRQLIAGTWENQLQLTLAPATSIKIKAEHVWDWRIVVQITDDTGALWEVFSRMQASGWNGTEFIELTDVSAITEVLPIYYWDFAEDEFIDIAELTGDGWNYATYAPTLLSARNLSTQIEDPENPGQYLTDWGYVVEFKFDQLIPNAALFPGDFKITDAYNTTWYGQTAVVSGQYIIVTFTDFNNAGNPITARALAGNLSSGYMLLTETAIVFNATGLVPTYIPPPVPQSITNLADWEVTQ